LKSIFYGYQDSLLVHKQKNMLFECTNAAPVLPHMRPEVYAPEGLRMDTRCSKRGENDNDVQNAMKERLIHAIQPLQCTTRIPLCIASVTL